MGNSNEKPWLDKNPVSGANNLCKWGVCSMQGWKPDMQDKYIAESIELPNQTEGTIFCVFDGHGGEKVAEFAQQKFISILKSQPEFKSGNYVKALRKTFLALDENLGKQDYAKTQGTTSCVVLLTPDKIYCANAGDSRSVLSNNKKAVALSDDHKPYKKEENQRISQAGHKVENRRIDGGLALSRALGDFKYKDNAKSSPEKQAVTANPDIKCRDRSSKDDFIFLASDGVWDCIGSQACINKMHKYVSELKDSDTASPVEKMFNDIVKPNYSEVSRIGTDNMTAILINLRN